MKIRVGLVGLGDAWESRHRPALRALTDRFEVRAVCVDVALRAEQVAGEFGAAAVDGFRALAVRSDIDAVLMLSPSWFGPLPILAACQAGKAIYCASPLDIDLHGAERIKKRVEDSGVAFMAEFPRRHAPATLRLKELLATRLGKPRLLFCHQRRIVERNGSRQRGSVHIPALQNLTELVDWCRYVVGDEPTSVLGVNHHRHGVAGDDDYQMLSLDFSPAGSGGCGPLAQISSGNYLTSSWPEAVSFRPPAQLQVSCEHGVAFVDLPATLIWFDEAGRHLESLESERPVGEQLLTQFHRAVTSLVRKTGDLEDAYRAVSIVQQAQLSSVEGRRVPLHFTPPDSRCGRALGAASAAANDIRA